MSARIWCKVGGRWSAFFGSLADCAGVLAALGSRVERWALDTAPAWPIGTDPGGLATYGGNDGGIRAAVAGWPDVCATCHESMIGPWGHRGVVWTGHGPECRLCAARYAD